MTKQENDILNTRTILIDKVSNVDFNARASKEFNQYLFLNVCEVSGTNLINLIERRENENKYLSNGFAGITRIRNRKKRVFGILQIKPIKAPNILQ